MIKEPVAIMQRAPTYVKEDFMKKNTMMEVSKQKEENVEYSFAVNTAYMQTDDTIYKPAKYKLIKIRR